PIVATGGRGRPGRRRPGLPERGRASLSGLGMRAGAPSLPPRHEHSGVASPARMEEAWSVPDVYLLTEGREGEVAVPHLTLTFLDTGLALDKADGEPVWGSDWSGLEEMSPVERSVLPDGRAGVVIVVVEQGRQHSHRFVLGTEDA